MDTVKSYNKLNRVKIVDTINFNGRYMDISAFKSKVITASAISAFFASFAAFLFILLS